MGYDFATTSFFRRVSETTPSEKGQGQKNDIQTDRRKTTPEAIRARLLDNQQHVGYVPFHKPKYTPLLMLEIEYRKIQRMDGIQILFALVIELCRLITGNNTAPETPRPLSPAMRQEIVKLDKTLKEYRFLCGNNIDSPQEIVSFIEEKREQIGALEKERQSVYNSSPPPILNP